ncbi:MAG TPA: long-chain fatty acid--CoA ligase [Candidatus Limnocylindrales bacterium]|nr:long-chain fatty acid--CoA ligase [Candidatus Limnocylindrales bacterium]
MTDSASYPTLTQCFLDAIDPHPNARAQMYRAASGWQAYSSAEMLRRIAGLAQALASLGVKAGDTVGIFAPNCPEWHVADFAVLGLGAADVPIYYNESPERLEYIWNDAGVKVAIVAGEAQARKLAACHEKIPALEKIIAVGAPAEFRGEFLDYAALIEAANDQDVAEYRRRASEVKPRQLATLIYTSGTTGVPKGVMLTHSNLTSNLIDATAAIGYFADDLQLSFLPLSHVYERTFDYTALVHGVTVAYLEKIEDAAKALLEVRPTIAAAVPRVFEKTYANILEKGHQETGVKRAIFDWALRVAEEAVPWKAHGKPPSVILKLKWVLANRLVYSKIREGIGGRMRVFYSGGAPLAKELAEFFWSVGVSIYQGYGLTESSPVISTNTPESNKVGTVGRPIQNCQVEIAEDGEILARGPNIMQGYYHKPDATREALTDDGWLRTGDIGHLDADGYLVITDRKKELLKTAAGKFVAPAPIENKLKSSAYISNAMVVGDRRKFVSVLIVPNFANIEAKARAEGIKVAPPETISADSWVRDLIGREVERLTANLAQYEKPKRFALLDKDFTFASGELTYTMKLKRRVVEERHQDAIAQLYADVEDPKPQAHI